MELPWQDELNKSGRMTQKDGMQEVHEPLANNKVLVTSANTLCNYIFKHNLIGASKFMQLFQNIPMPSKAKDANTHASAASSFEKHEQLTAKQSRLKLYHAISRVVQFHAVVDQAE